VTQEKKKKMEQRFSDKNFHGESPLKIIFQAAARDMFGVMGILFMHQNE